MHPAWPRSGLPAIPGTWGSGDSRPQIPGVPQRGDAQHHGAMTTTRADAVRGRLTTLAAAGLDAGAFALGAADLLARAVPFESACVGTADPETSLMTGSYKFNLPDSRDAEFLHLEYGVPDVNSFSELARRPVPVGVLVHDTQGRPETSPRWRDFLMPHFDLGHELRASIRSEGRVWGMVSLYRSAGTSGFSPAEADFVAGVLSTLEAGLRAGLVVSAAAAVDDGAAAGPAVLVIGADDAVRQVTPAAAARLAELAGTGGEALPLALLSIVAAARAFGAGRTASAPRVRVRTRAGRWFVVHAAPLAAAPGVAHGAPASDVVVTIEPARPSEVVPLLTAAYGLTQRENDVVRLVLQGASTAEIGGRLHLSPYTVQDHLKSIFDKTGVRSRRELTASLFFDQYAARTA